MRCPSWRSQARPVTAERVIAADQEPQNWLAHGRTYGEQRYSPLKQINDGNVEQLGLAWSYATGTTRGLQATPIIVDGRMYATGVWSVVYALDAKTGRELWTYDPQVPREWGRYACCDAVNRGVALWADALYFATLDGRLISLDARTRQEALGDQHDRPHQALHDHRRAARDQGQGADRQRRRRIRRTRLFLCL